MKGRKGNRVWDSMGAAASDLGVDVGALKRAKESGCKAFRGSRVYERELLDWMTENSGSLKSTSERTRLQNSKLLEECRKLKLHNDAKEGTLVPRLKVMESIGRVLAAADTLIEQKLCLEYPSAVSGMDIPQCRIFGARLGDQLRAELRKLSEEWK